jgi:hypothetical protein
MTIDLIGFYRKMSPKVRLTPANRIKPLDPTIIKEFTNFFNGFNVCKCRTERDLVQNSSNEFPRIR